MKRRDFLALGALAALPPVPAAATTGYPAAQPGYRLVFPRDHGAHPEFRTEWW